MDEPLAALDRTRREEILPFLDRLHTELAVPIIYVSHSVDEVTRLCDHLLVMSGGRIVASGSLQQVLLRSDVPILGGEEAGAIIQVRAAAVDTEFGLTRVVSGGSELWVPGRYDPGSELRLRIRANDVSICRERPAATTIMNILPATVESIFGDGEATELVQLAVGGASILARITRRSCLQLGIRPGEAVLAQIKSVAVKKAPASRG